MEYISGVNPSPHYPNPNQPNTNRSFLAEKVVAIALIALGFLGANAVDSVNPALAMFIRISTGGVGLIWLFSRCCLNRKSYPVVPLPNAPLPTSVPFSTSRSYWNWFPFRRHAFPVAQTTTNSLHPVPISRSPIYPKSSVVPIPDHVPYHAPSTSVHPDFQKPQHPVACTTVSSSGQSFIGRHATRGFSPTTTRYSSHSSGLSDHMHGSARTEHVGSTGNGRPLFTVKTSR